MSAFIVSKAHIDALVVAAMDRDPLTWSDCELDGLWGDCDTAEQYWAIVGQHQHKADGSEADRIGRFLWLENLASVAYRYPEDTSGTRPGAGDTDEDIAAYTLGRRPRAALEPVAVLKAINGYIYQASEHPGWKRSEARYFCEALKERMIRRLPGYEDAPWEVAA